MNRLEQPQCFEFQRRADSVANRQAPVNSRRVIMRRAGTRGRAVVTSLALVAAAPISACATGADHSSARAAASATAPSAPRSHGATLRPRLLGRLPAPVQLPAAVLLPGGDVLVLGGLSSADTSLSSIFRVRGGRGAPAGTLPVAQHDAAAAYLDGRTYLFGGGGASGSSGSIVEVDARGGTRPAGSALPVPASDVSAAVVDGTAYIVGGYTGSAPLDTVVAFRPGAPVRVVARLPRPLRYAAVGRCRRPIDHRGRDIRRSGSARHPLLRPKSGRVTRIGRLPSPLTHAASASLGGTLYVIGGRSDSSQVRPGRFSRWTPGPAPSTVPGGCPNRCPTPPRWRARVRSWCSAAGTRPDARETRS